MFGGQSSRVEYAAHAEFGYLRHTRIQSWTWIFVGPTNDLKRAKSSGLVSLSVFAHDDDSTMDFLNGGRHESTICRFSHCGWHGAKT